MNSVSVMSESQIQNKSSDEKNSNELNGEMSTEADTQTDLLKKWAFDDWTQLYRIAIKFFRGLTNNLSII